MRELNCLHTQWFLCKWKPCETMNVKQTTKCSSVHCRPQALGSTPTTVWWGRVQLSAGKYFKNNEGNANELPTGGGNKRVSQKYTPLYPLIKRCLDIGFLQKMSPSWWREHLRDHSQVCDSFSTGQDVSYLLLWLFQEIFPELPLFRLLLFTLWQLRQYQD